MNILNCWTFYGKYFSCMNSVALFKYFTFYPLRLWMFERLVKFIYMHRHLLCVNENIKLGAQLKGSPKWFYLLNDTSSSIWQLLITKYTVFVLIFNLHTFYISQKSNIGGHFEDENFLKHMNFMNEFAFFTTIKFVKCKNYSKVFRL